MASGLEKKLLFLLISLERDMSPNFGEWKEFLFPFHTPFHMRLRERYNDICADAWSRLYGGKSHTFTIFSIFHSFYD